MEKTLPIALKLTDKNILVVGGGSIASFKINILVNFSKSITVVSPKIDESLLPLVETGKIIWIKDEYSEKYLDDKYLVISATDDQQINTIVYESCKRRKILINTVDEISQCDFYMPAIVEKGPITIAISTNGYSPTLARILKDWISNFLPNQIGDFAVFCQSFRSLVKSKYPTMTDRIQFWQKIVKGAVYKEFMQGEEQKAEELLKESILDGAQKRGEVVLVGAGPGDPDLLTLKAFKEIQTADTVLYDRLVSPEILKLIPHEVKKIDVGKGKGKSHREQMRIHELMDFYAAKGDKIVRLKGGDPFIFGRGGEEIELLLEKNIPFRIVPGITSALGCAANFSIPLTHRDYAKDVTFLSGNNKDNTLDYNWDHLANGEKTLVFYMGMANLDSICENLMGAGMRGTTPVAIIENATFRNESIRIFNIEDTAFNKQIGKSPGTIIIGDVVNLVHGSNVRGVEKYGSVIN